MSHPKAPARKQDTVVGAFIVPTMPHPLLIPEKNPGYQRLRDAYEAVRQRIDELDPDVIVLYSTRWMSVIGHQVQTRAAPTWEHVDEEWHELGTMPYTFRMDVDYGASFVEYGRQRGLEMRGVDYHGFPIDTGTVVALKLLDPDNKHAASVVSCNMYADRTETLVLGKAARDAAEAEGKRVVAIAVTNLSNRVHHKIIDLADDRVHSLKDDEWNRKYLEFLEDGRLEDASQLARQFSAQAHGDQKMKAIWWLAAFCGQTNDYEGHLYGYEGVYGCGCALVGLTPSAKPAADLEFDEDDAESYSGDRNVLDTDEERTDFGSDQPGARFDPERKQQVTVGAMTEPDADEAAGGGSGGTAALTVGRTQSEDARGIVRAAKAPKPVGAYPHARRVGDLLFLSGLGPRDPETNAVPGGPVKDADGKRLDYDIRAQTEAVIENTRLVLESCGATLDDLVDVQVFLIDMDRDFQGFNEVYKKHFENIQATRTTVAIDALPTPIAVEFKVLAHVPADRSA